MATWKRCPTKGTEELTEVLRAVNLPPVIVTSWACNVCVRGPKELRAIRRASSWYSICARHLSIVWVPMTRGVDFRLTFAERETSMTKKRLLLALAAAAGLTVCVAAALPWWASYRATRQRDSHGYSVGLREGERPRPTLTILEPTTPAVCKVGERIRVVIRCEFASESGPPSAILGSLGLNKAIRESRIFDIRPDGPGVYTGSLEFDPVKLPGKYTIAAKCMDYLQSPRGEKPRSEITAEAEVLIQVGPK